MRDKPIGKYTVVIFAVHILTAKIFTSSIMLYARHSASAAWLEVLLSACFSAIFGAIFLKLSERFDNKSILSIAEVSFGGVGKILLGSLMTIVFLLNSAAVLRSFLEMIRNCILPNMPYEYIALFAAVPMVIAAYLGLGAQLRLNNLIFPLVAAALLLTVLVNINHCSSTGLTPVLGRGAQEMITSAAFKNSSFYEIGLLTAILPYLKRRGSLKSTYFTSLGIAAAVMVLTTAFYQMAVPYEAAAEFELPVYQMSRMLRAGSFMQRLEPLNMLVWSGTFFVYLGFGLWLSAHTLRDTFSLKSRRATVFVLAEIIVTLSLIPGSETTVERIYDFILSYAYIIYPILPTVLLIIAAVSRRRRSKVC